MKPVRHMLAGRVSDGVTSFHLTLPYRSRVLGGMCYSTGADRYKAEFWTATTESDEGGSMEVHFVAVPFDKEVDDRIAAGFLCANEQVCVFYSVTAVPPADDAS